MTPVNESGWTPWQSLSPGLVVSEAVLAETLDGGQAFRWQRDSRNHWLGYFGRVVVRVSLDARNHLHWSAPVSLAAEVATALPTYFQVEAQRPELVDTLPWRSDPHLARCLAAFPGLRILRQPFGETLLGFLCSATKQIVQIKQMIALLAARHGAPLIPVGTSGMSTAFRLPTWPEIARIPESELRACLLGFRARYIHQTAIFLADQPGWLE
jgi:N-glycosylase/DNA lyase